MKPSALALMGTASFYGGPEASGSIKDTVDSRKQLLILLMIKKKVQLYAEPFRRINNLLSEIIYFFAFTAFLLL